MTRFASPGRPRRARRAFSLAEAAIATLLVAVLLVAALHTVGGAAQSSRLSAERASGLFLADELLAEILSAAYAEPLEASVFGPEPSERIGTRAAFDDVDDYHNWSASPPQAKDGTPLARRDGWARSVTVVWVNPSDLTQPSATETGVKRVTVTVTYAGKTVARLVGVRAAAE